MEGTVGDSGDRDTFLWRRDPSCALVLSFNAFLFRVSCSCSGAVAVAAREVHATRRRCVCVDLSCAGAQLVSRGAVSLG